MPIYEIGELFMEYLYGDCSTLHDHWTLFLLF